MRPPRLHAPGAAALGTLLLLIATPWLASAPAVASPHRPSYCDAVPGNLVANCGFETGDFTGWTLTDDDNGYTTVARDPHSGTYTAAFGNITGVDAVLSQTLHGTPGAVYRLSFWVSSIEDASHLVVSITQSSGATRSWDDSAQRGGLDVYRYTQVKHRFRFGPDGRVTLSFAGQNRDGFLLLDDVNATPLDAGS